MLLVYLIIIVAAVLLAGYAYEQAERRKDAARPLTGELIHIGNYRIHVTDRGQGGPAVVILHGAGDCSYSWMHVSREVAKFTRVVTYDRAGMGSSDPGPAPTAVHTVQELHAILSKAGIPGPYVLAGHSLGGLIARLYALEHPDQVAGLVFLDSTHEHLKDDVKFKQGFAAIGVMIRIMKFLSAFGIPRFMGNVFGLIPMFGSERAYYQRQLSAEEYKLWRGMVYRIFAGNAAAAEFKGAWDLIAAASHRLDSSGRTPQFADLPIAVLNNPGFGDNWTAMQKELASRSTNNTHRTSDRKGHSLQMPRPEYVVEAIGHVVEQARQREARRSS
jgi:pimeloyl-ACP methyl ester carboxylesterase